MMYSYSEIDTNICAQPHHNDTPTNYQHDNVESCTFVPTFSSCVSDRTMAFITAGFIARQSGRLDIGRCRSRRDGISVVRRYPRAEVSNTGNEESEETVLISDESATKAKAEVISAIPESELSAEEEVSVPLISDKVSDERDVVQLGIDSAIKILASGGELYSCGAEYYDSTALPKLYDAWFAPNHELCGAMKGAVERAHADGLRQLEIQFPMCPNVEEIEAGTRLNQLFGFQIAADLGLSSRANYPLIKRYLASFSNLYWAKRVATVKPFLDSKVYAIRSDSVRLDDADLTGIDEVLSAGRKLPKLQDNDVAIMIDPRYNDAWYNGAKMRKDAENSTVVFLNSQFSETYGLTGPRRWEMKETEVVYMLKRVTRGYVFKAYGAPWRAYLEKPDCSVEIVEEYEKEPKLSTVARRVREESNNRYGGFYNDRYVRGMGGRL